MRVTADMMVSHSVRRLSNRMASYEKVQQQVATGKQWQKPSEAPAEANTSLALRAAQRSRAQQQRAAADAESWMNITDNQLQSAVDLLHRLRDLTVSADPRLGAGEGDAIAAEMRAIGDGLRSIANTRYRGRPVFGGFSDADPILADGSIDGTVGGEIARRVGEGDEVRINVLATEAFTTGGQTVFTMVEDLATDVEAGVGVSGRLGDIDAAFATLSGALGRLGATGNHLESARQRTIDSEMFLRTELSRVEDVDVAEAVMNLQVEQVAFEATLKAVGTALPPSLVNFI